MKAFVLVLVLSLGSSSLAQIISVGQCPQHPVKQDFDVAAYLGEWYEIYRYEQVNQRNGECVKAVYTLNDDGSVRVENSMLVPPSGKFTVDVGKAVVSFPAEDPLQAKLNVSFAGMPPIMSNYWVLDTDYTTFAFVWSCFTVSDNIKGENFWLLSRTVDLPESVQDLVNKMMDTYLERRHVRTTLHNLYYCVNGEDETTTTDSAKSHAKPAELRSKRING